LSTLKLIFQIYAHLQPFQLKLNMIVPLYLRTLWRYTNAVIIIIIIIIINFEKVNYKNVIDQRKPQAV